MPGVSRALRSSPEAGLSCPAAIFRETRGYAWGVGQSRAQGGGVSPCSPQLEGSLWQVPPALSPGPQGGSHGWGRVAATAFSELGRASRTAGGLLLSGFIIRSKIKESCCSDGFKQGRF